MTILLFLVFAVPTLTWAETLSIQLRGIEGKWCQPADESYESAGLYLDYIGSSGADSCIGCKSIEGIENMQSMSIRLDVDELPSASSGKRIFLRFYSLHSTYNANHYEANLNLTQEFAASLQAGVPVRKTLSMKGNFGDRKFCRLTFEFIRKD